MARAGGRGQARWGVVVAVFGGSIGGQHVQQHCSGYNGRRCCILAAQLVLVVSLFWLAASSANEGPGKGSVSSRRPCSYLRSAVRAPGGLRRPSVELEPLSAKNRNLLAAASALKG
jgi:hypothetical protein